MSYYKEPFYGYFYLNTALDAQANGTPADYTLSPATVMLAKYGLDIAQNQWAWRSNGEYLTDAEWVQAEDMVDIATEEFYLNNTTPAPPALPDAHIHYWMNPSLGLLNPSGNYPADLDPIASMADGRGDGYHVAIDDGVSSRQGQYDEVENAIRFLGDDYYLVPNFTASQPIIIAGQVTMTNDNPSAQQRIVSKGPELGIYFNPNYELVLRAGILLESGQYYTASQKHSFLGILNSTSSEVYLDGVGTSGDAGTIDWSNEVFWIGSRNGLQSMQGLIYGITIANYADPSYKTILEDYYAV